MQANWEQVAKKLYLEMIHIGARLHSVLLEGQQTIGGDMEPKRCAYSDEVMREKVSAYNREVDRYLAEVRAARGEVHFIVSMDNTMICEYCKVAEPSEGLYRHAGHCPYARNESPTKKE